MARPYVVAHIAVSVDGSATGFGADVGTFYQIAASWGENVTLAGADTILAQREALETTPRPGPAEKGPVLAVVDSRARVEQWDALREAGHWSDVLAIHARSTPPRPADRGVAELIVGEDRVDLTAALAELGRRGAEVVRVDSGGRLTAALWERGLLDEVSLLIHPALSDGDIRRPWYGTTSAPADLELVNSETVGGGLVWTRYRLRNS